MIEIADRIGNTKEYYFSEKLKEINQMISEGKDVINLGIGSPDLMPPTYVIESLNSSSIKKNIHGYQSYKGIPKLRNAISSYYDKHFGVYLNPETECLPLNGSKEGITLISLAFLNPGDEVLIPNPGYPTYKAAAELVQAKLRFYDIIDDNLNLEQIENKDLSKVKLMWINFPHMPTGQQGSLRLFKNIQKFAKRNNILIVNDNPYAHILTKTPLSILQAPGSKENCLELNSLSKSFNMAGWRVGMVSGCKKKIDAILRVKSNMDSGMFYGLQQGAAKALLSDHTWFETLNRTYEKRKLLICELAKLLNLSFNTNQSGLFLWAKVKKDKNGEEFSSRILKEANIFITPGEVFGSNGKNHVRISLCIPENRIKEAIKRVKTLLK